MGEKALNPQQEMFLDYLFSGTDIMHPDEAKQRAGYPKNYPVIKIIKGIQKELLERADEYLAMHTPAGVTGLVNIMNNPHDPGNKIKLQAIIEILDRGGVVKKEKAEVAAPTQNFIFTLPSKIEIKE